MIKTIEVVSVIDKRVGAKIAQECYKDLTPKDEIEKVKSSRYLSLEKRDRGVGRPTKKERRDIEDFKTDSPWSDWEEWND